MVAQTKPETFLVTNPATGEVVREVPIRSREDVALAMVRARRAGKFWAALSVSERCRRLFRVGEVITRRMDELVDLVSRENGKVKMEALCLDVGPVLTVLNYFLQHAEEILADEPIRLAMTPHRASFLSYQPKGVVAVISPWNFPFFIPAADALMALIAGNAVMIKPSEVAPLSALAFKDCVDEAGLDPELLQVVPGLGETGSALIDARPDHVVFTGSVATGRRIGVACAERMITCTLELGGKAPAVVLDDADVERTVEALLWGGFANTGQICASVERVYAMSGVYDQVVDRLSEKAKGLDLGRDVGAMTFPRQTEIVERLVDDAKQKGARVMAGGSRPDSAGLFYPPTVLADCTTEMDVMRDEAFGPIVPIMKVDSAEQAVELANDSELGLGAYVFTSNRERGKEIATKIEAGSIMVNDVLMHAGMPETPWGGIKSSGHGVMRSDRGLKELCHARHVSYDRVAGWSRDPHWYPYDATKFKRMRSVFGSLFAKRPWSGLIRRIIT